MVSKVLKLAITTSDLLGYEPVLDEYYHENTTDFGMIIDKSVDMLVGYLQTKNIDLRNIYRPILLPLGMEVRQGLIDRRRLICELHAVPSQQVIFSLLGRNNLNEDYELVLTLQGSSNPKIETLTQKIDKSYNYYKLVQNIEVSSKNYLIETTLELPLTMLALYRVFVSLSDTPNDIWSVKAEEYKEQYYSLINQISIPMDIDNSGDYESSEMTDTNTINIGA